MTKKAASERHLLVAAISLADVKATMAFARLILQRLPATPAGLLVATRIAGLATGSKHRIVAPRGELREIPSDEQVQRSTKREARAVGSLISELAAGRSAHLSCEVVEGDLVTCACAAVAEEDVLLLCQRPILGFHGNVLLLGTARAQSATASSLAHDLAKASSTSVSEVYVGEHADEAELFQVVDRSRAAVIVVDLSAGPITDEEKLRRLVAAARCPVIAIGANRIIRPDARAQEDEPDS